MACERRPNVEESSTRSPSAKPVARVLPVLSCPVFWVSAERPVWAGEGPKEVRSWILITYATAGYTSYRRKRAEYLEKPPLTFSGLVKVFTKSADGRAY